jgi:hypothetical protein
MVGDAIPATAWLEPSDALHGRVQAVIARALRPADGSVAAEIDALALDIARYQARHVPAVAQLYATRGIDPAALRSVTEIPALPCEIFRLRRVAAHASRDDVRCFRSSGTTLGADARAAHPMRTLASTTRAALGWGATMLWPDHPRLGFIGLAAPAELADDSSLSFMLGRFAEQLDPDASWHFDGRQLDAQGVVRACERARGRGEPTLVAGTALALVELCERLGGRSLPLPAGSRVMQTGGFKATRREIAPAELRRLAGRLFALPESHVVGEYGMTELSSQLYEGTLRRALGLGFASAEPGCYFAPPWVRVTVVDPETLAPATRGEVGLCQLLDLANVDSAVSILTADLVREHADGSFELRGRAPGAEPRGCSLTIDDLA